MSLLARLWNMSKIFGHTVTRRQASPQQMCIRCLPAFMLVALTALSGCSSTPEVGKVGIIAPFEGLYRNTGYGALDSVRQAISDCAPADANLVPLALDDSAQPFAAERSARKMLVDPAVVGIIGPFSLDTLEAVTPHLAGGGPIWAYAAAVTREGALANTAGGLGWLSDLVVAIANRAASAGASSTIVAGVPPAWIAEVEADVDASAVEVPVRFRVGDLDLADIGASEALIWLGEPHLAAVIADELASVQPDAAFWMGPSGGDPVFSARSQIDGKRYWVSWVTPQYNSNVQPAPGEVASQLTYAVTCRVLAEQYATSAVNQPPLRIQAFRIDEDGISVPLPEQ